MRVITVAALLLFLTAARAEDLKVPSDWKVVGVAVSTSRIAALSSRETRRTLDRASETIEKELPGIRWHVSRDIRSARYEDKDGPAIIEGVGFARIVERLAEKDKEIAEASCVFLFAPLPDSTYSGMSAMLAHTSKRAIPYSVVNTRQGHRFAQNMKPLERVFDRGPIRAFALHATTVHEFGHLLAPDGHMIGNGEDEPSKHDLACIMYTPRERKSLVAKLREFPHLLQFCDRCRERLGCPVK
jgi:hypothetical protein